MSRKIDALVAEHVMGLNDVESFEKGPFQNNLYYNPYDDPNGWEVVPNYSTDIADAWEVVEKQKPNWLSLDGCGSEWNVTFHDSENIWVANSDTAPMAICLAALKVKGVEVD